MIDRRKCIGIGSAAGLLTGRALSAALAADAPATPAAPGATVQTNSGKVRGSVHNKVHAFKGVPYGASTAGSGRFMPPAKPQPWSGIHDCLELGPRSPQLVSSFKGQVIPEFEPMDRGEAMGEDCLRLNLCTAGVGAAGKRPVMVWLHGGGYTSGSGGFICYDGEQMARKQDVVVITVNHRLTAVGFLYLGDLGGAKYADSGNAGMLDLVAALEWVRDNAAAFGGDPGNVMIMGQSGGGAKVSTLMAMPSAKGLFHKAAIQSGPGLTVGRKEAATASARKLLDALGVAPGDIKALRAIPAETIIRTVMKTPGAASAAPILDAVVPQDPFLAGGPAVSADVPVLVGWCKDEWTIFTAGEPWFGRMTEADLQARVKPLGASAEHLLAAYRAAYPTYSPTYLWEQMLSGRVMFGSELLASRKAAQKAAPAYVYMVAWETPAGGGVFKTPHTMEIPFMLYSYDKVRTFVGPGPGPKHMADQIGGAWVAFARTGVPDHAGVPHWPAWNDAQRPVMVFDTHSKVVDDPLPGVRQALLAAPQMLTFRG